MREILSTFTSHHGELALVLIYAWLLSAPTRYLVLVSARNSDQLVQFATSEFFFEMLHSYSMVGHHLFLGHATEEKRIQCRIVREWTGQPLGGVGPPSVSFLPGSHSTVRHVPRCYWHVASGR
jgi:hypothetical protein